MFNRMLRDIWVFRGVILSTVKREFQSKWRGTQLGPFWIVAQPLATIFIFTFIFAEIMKPTLPHHESKFAYSIYLCSGLITWNFFSEFLSRCVTIFIDNADIIKKVSLPKICLPVIALFSSSLHFGIVFSLFCVFLILSGTFPGLVILAVIPVFAIQIAFTVGLGILLATVNVFYRDIQQTLGLIMQFWFWLTPIVYLPSGLPAPVETILQLNPMWPIIRGYQTIFLNQLSPDWWGLLYPAFLAILLLSLGLAAFRQLQGEIVDEL